MHVDVGMHVAYAYAQVQVQVQVATSAFDVRLGFSFGPDRRRILHSEAELVGYPMRGACA